MDFINYEIAEAIAITAHDGQKRRNGDIYINHPLRVASILTSKEEKIIAILHDVFEDNTTYTLVYEAKLLTPYDKSECVGWCIKLSGKVIYRLPLQTYVALQLLIHKDNMTYQEYIGAIAINPLASKVKMADITDNLCDNPSTHQKCKYRLAMRTLLSHQ